MENEPGQSGVRQCHVCEKFSSLNNFKENSCRQCWKWFLFNCDEYFHKESKNICPYNCETVSCKSCYLKKFLKITQYRCGQRQCTSCGCKTVIKGKNPQCSCCRILAAKKCICNITIRPCSWCVKKASNMRKKNIVVESSFANEKPCFELQSTSDMLLKPTAVPSMLEQRAKLPANDVIKGCETLGATLQIDLSLLPIHLQAEAKTQVLGKCFVKLYDLSSTILKNTRKGTEERKAKKRLRNDSWTRSEDSCAAASTSDLVDHGESLRKKPGKEWDSLDYNVMNVSDTRLILRLGMEHRNTDIDSHVGSSRHMDAHLTNKKKSHVPRKNNPVKREFPLAHRDIVPMQELKSELKMKDGALQRATDEKSTQTEPLIEIECLQSRINELELIIASLRSCHAPSPLDANLPPKIPDDPTLTLSTPPNSDSGFSIKNLTPTKSPCVLVNRLTKDVLEHYGISRNPSESPTEEPLPKTYPCLNSIDSEHRSFKKSNKKNDVKDKVLELFGNDSEEDVSPTKDMLETCNAQPFDLEELDYDKDEDEDSRTSTSYSAEIQPISNPGKSKKKDRHDKSSQREKKETKDKRTVNEQKKREDKKTKKSDTLKSSKAFKEKEVNKPRKNQTPAANCSKFRIPKLTASATVGLPSLLQENLEQASKTTTTLPPEEPPLSRTLEPEPVKNSITMSTELPKVPSNVDCTIELPDSSSSSQISCKIAPPILCILPKNRNNKSVNFPEQLEAVRSISPRCQLQDPEQISEDPSSQENFIPTILEDLQYVPESSLREPVNGIRSFHPPIRKINREKLKSLAHGRGGRRFIYSSSSSSSSENESSENESNQENKSNANPEELPSQTPYFAAMVSSVERRSIANDSFDIQLNGSDVSMRYIVQETVEKPYLSSTETIASETLNTTVKCMSRIADLAVNNDSTKNSGFLSVSEERLQSISPKKTLLPSLAVSPSPRRHSPEPIPQASYAQTKANDIEMKNFEKNDSEDEDVLDIGLNDGEIFDYGYDEGDELDKPLSPKLPAAEIINGSSEPACKKDSQPSPVKTVMTSIRTNMPEVHGKPSVIPRSTVPAVSHPPHLKDEQMNSRGLCHVFIRTGKCTISDKLNKKCHFSHDLDLVVEHIQFMCNKKGGNIMLASRLVTSMTNAESPLNKSLCEPIGFRIVDIVIRALLMEKRPDQVVYALELFSNLKLPIVAEFIDPLIQHTPDSPANAKQLMTVYERCQQNRIKISLHSFYVLLKFLLRYQNLTNWDFIYNLVEHAIMDYPRSFKPSHEVLDFLFRLALDKLRLERLCRLLSNAGPPALIELGSERCHQVLSRLRDFCLLDWYNRYSRILCRPIENEMHSHFVAPPYQPNGIMNHSFHDPSLSLHREQHSLLQASRPPLYNTRPQILTLPPTGLHGPSTPSWEALQRLPPPSVSPVSLHRTQQPPTLTSQSVVREPHPPAPVAYVTRNPAESVTRSTSNGTASLPLKSLSLPPIDVDSSTHINESPPFIPLQVPKPSYSLAVDPFEPESPEVEPVFVDSEPELGPSVVVEPTHGIEDELLAEYKIMNFKAVTRLFLKYYSGNRKCPMLASLMQIMKTNPLYGPEDNQELSPGDIFVKIIMCACERGSPETLERRQQQALLDLVFFVLLDFLQTYNTSDDDEQITQRELVKQFVKMVLVFQLSLDNFIKHLELLLFVAECFLQIDISKEEEEDFMEGVADDICLSTKFLIEFHETVTEIHLNAFDSTLVEKEFEVTTSLAVLVDHFNKLPGFKPYLNGVLGAVEDFESAAMKNKARFRALISSLE